MNVSAVIPQQGELGVDQDHANDSSQTIGAQQATTSVSAAAATEKRRPIFGGLVRHSNKPDVAMASPIIRASSRVSGRVGRRTAIMIGLCLVLFGGSFYGGTMYQNNQDHSIASQYVPAQSANSFGAAVSGGTNSQVAAALSVGEPPSSNGAATTTDPQTGTSAGSTAGNTPATSGSTSNGPTSAGSQIPSGPAATSAASSLNGQIAGLSSTSLTVHTRQGADQTIAVGSATRYFVAQAATQAALTTGTRVVVASSAASGQQSATSITIVPSAAVAVSVQPTGTGQRSAQGTAPGQSSPQGQGTSGASQGQGFSPGQRTVLAGTIAVYHGNTLTLTTTQGTSVTLALSKTTHVYRVTPTTLAQVEQNWSVAVSTTTTGSSSTASTVVASSVANTGVRMIPVQ